MLVGLERVLAPRGTADPGQDQVAQGQGHRGERQQHREQGGQDVVVIPAEGARIHLAGERDGAHRHQESQQHGSGIPHEHVRRLEVVAEEPEADAEGGHGQQARRRGPGQVLFVGEHVRVGEERPRPDRHQPGGQPVQPIDEVDGIGAHRDEDDRDQDAAGVVEGKHHVRQGNPVDPDPSQHGRPRGQHLATEFHDWTQLDHVIDQPDGADQTARQEHHQGVVPDRGETRQERHVHGQYQADDQSAEHREPTEVGFGAGVHVARPHLRHRVPAQGQLTAHRREQVGGGGGDQ